MQIRIRDKKIGDESPVFIVAEIGTNHNGRPDLAFRLIDEAARAGVDALKLQVVNPEESYVKGTPSYKIFKKIYLDFDVLKDLKKEAERKGLVFFATPGDLSSLNMLLELKVPMIKISSGCMTHLLLTKKAARTGLPIIVSTGMSYLKEIKEAVSGLEKNGAREIILLHCVSLYPAAYKEINLNAIVALRSFFKYPVGYSDHTMGNPASFTAVAMGAKVIEKHFTLDKKLKGTDHALSADPRELKELVDGIRDIEKMMGKPIKKPVTKEKLSRATSRRFLVFAKDLAKNSVLNEKDVGVKRIIRGRGLSPEYYNSVIGKKIVEDVKKDKPIRLSLIK